MGLLGYDMIFMQEPDFLRVTVCGTYNLWRSKRAWMRICKEAKRRGVSKVLVDGHQVKGGPSPEELYEEGLYVAAHVPLKIALLRPGTKEHFGEWTAVQGGADVMIFEGEPAAIAWLLRG